MSFECKECGENFTFLRSLHAHIKKHGLYLGDYYVKHFQKKDKLKIIDEHLELESFGYNYKFLNLEGGKYRIDFIANNTFMKLDQETELFTNAPFRVNHLERVPS